MGGRGWEGPELWNMASVARPGDVEMDVFVRSGQRPEPKVETGRTVKHEQYARTLCHSEGKVSTVSGWMVREGGGKA